MTSVRRMRDKLRASLAGHSTGVQDPPARLAETAKQVAMLRRRIERLEAEVQENRRLNRRLAELTDIVQELLVPIAQRDEDKLRERLEKYSESL